MSRLGALRCVCAVSWATWLLFTGVPARCVVLCVRCPGPPGSCSPVCPLGVVLRLRCPGPLGSCSPVCPLGGLCSVRCILGQLAPLPGCGPSACCVACAVFWATWLLFTGVPARCVVLYVRCVGPLGSCSPVCTLGVLCCVCGVFGDLAPVHRCARCKAGTHPSGQRLFVACRAWVPSGRAHVHRDGGCFVAGRCWICCRAHTGPFGRRLFRSWHGLGSLPGAHISIWTAARAAWHLFSCSGLLRVVRAVRVCGTRRPLLLGTRPCALVVAGAIPLWRASWPRVVCRASSGLVALGAPVGCPDAVVPLPLTGRLRWARRGRPRTGFSSWLPLAPAEAGALGSLCFVPVRGPAMALSLAGSSGVGFGLRALRSVACVDPVTHASSFSYRPSFDGGLGRCTGAVSCGRRHLRLRAGGRHAWVPCVCACAPPSWPALVGRSLGRVLVRLTFALACCFVGPPPGWRRPFLVLLLTCLLFVFFFFFPFLCACNVSCFLWFRPRVSWALAPCGPSPPAPYFLVARFVFLFVSCGPPFPLSRDPPLFFFPFCAPPLSLAFSGSGPGCLGPWRRVAPSLHFVFPGPLWFSVCFLPLFLRCCARVCLLGIRRRCPPFAATPPPPAVRVLPCAVWCRRAVVPFPSGVLWWSRSCVLQCRVAVFCAAGHAVLPRLTLLWAAARWAVFVGVVFSVLCCAFGCCCVLRLVFGRAVRLRCSRCGLLSRFGLRCRVLCCAVSQCAVLHVVSPAVVLLFAVLFGFVRFVPLLAVPCPLALPVALRSCAFLRFVVFPRTVCSVLCVFCRGALVCAVGRRCDLCCVRAVCSLSSVLCVVLRCAELVRLRCAVCVVCAGAGGWCCGALLCVVLFPLVFCGAVLGLVACGCVLAACFGVGVPVLPGGLLPCGWPGLLWCPVPL